MITMKERIQSVLYQCNQLLEQLIKEIDELYRPVTPEDFENKDRNQLKAMFFNPRGNIYLENGVTYTIRYMKERNKVSIPYNYNLSVTTPNSGYECSMKNFYILKGDNE